MKCEVQIYHNKFIIEPKTTDRVCSVFDILIARKVYTFSLNILYTVVDTACIFQRLLTSCKLMYYFLFYKKEIDEYKLNGYLQFIMVLYQNYDDYFYQNDLKLLIEILVR